MCFAKSTPKIIAPVEKQQPIVRHEADASVTKNSLDERHKGAFLQNVKTSAFGLEDNASIKKKTLLGEQNEVLQCRIFSKACQRNGRYF